VKISERRIICKKNTSTSEDTFLLETIRSIDDLLQQLKTDRIILYGFKIKELNGLMRNKLCNIIIIYMEDHNIVL